MGFRLAVDENVNRLSITQNGRTIWDTAPDKDFLSASGGEDIVTAANGNFKIEEVDEHTCTGLDITKVSLGCWQGSDSNQTALVQGQLTGCGDSTVPFTVAFWVPSQFPDRIAFTAQVNNGSASGTHEQSVSYMSLNVSRLWWNWENDENLYPTWSDFVQSLRNRHNIRTLAYINPFLANVSIKADGQGSLFRFYAAPTRPPSPGT
ncbi:hypothetical protein BJX64DRAFT_288738 [Aspergillus heterothallicus]